MTFKNAPESTNQKFTLAKFSGWCSGLSWFLLFSVLFTDGIFDMGKDGSEAAIYLCIGPFFLLAMLGFLVGIITSLISRKDQASWNEDDQDFARNGLRYGLMGIGFVILAPLLNRLLQPLIGIELYDITQFFR